MPVRCSRDAWDAPHRQALQPGTHGLSEGLAVMLSVVVFGLGVAALVAQQELRAPVPGLVATHVAPHATARSVP